MKIVTLNTWGKRGPYEKRFPIILRELKELEPDIVCLQEVFDSELKDPIQKTCGFKNSHECYPAGLVILSRFPFQQTKTHPYKTVSPNETNDRHAIFSQVRMLPSPLSSPHFMGRGRGEGIWITNTHLSWKAEDAETRLGQVSELLNDIKPLSESIVLTGDFNCTPDSAPIQKLKEAGFIELFGHLQPKKDGFTWDNDRNPHLKTHPVIFPNRRIDMILANQNFLEDFQPKTCELVFTIPDKDGTFSSDHFGLLAEFV